MKKYLAKEVFTPTKPASITFVERDSLTDRLVNALRTPGKQIVLFGHSGAGKSTLILNKVFQLYEHHVTSRCITGMSLDQVILEAFDQLAPYYLSSKTSEKDSLAKASLEHEYAGIKASIETSYTARRGATHSRLLPPQLTPQNLGRLLGESKACWVIEDFHKIGSVEKARFSNIMKVFADMSEQYSDLKIVALGAVFTAREVVEYDMEMRNRVAEIFVPLVPPEELRQIIAKGEQALNVRFDAATKEAIVAYSSGLASVCHHLCLNACQVIGLEETAHTPVSITDVTMQEAVRLYLDDASDTLKATYEKAFSQHSGRYENARLIVQALTHFDADGATHAELLGKIRLRQKDYPSSNLSHYLKTLQAEERGAVLRHNPSSGRYFFSDPIYRAFALALLRNGRPHNYDVNQVANMLQDILKKLVANEFTKYTDG